MDDPRYPVGRFDVEEAVTPERRAEWLRQVEEAPARLRAAVDGLSDEQLDTPYRDGGWTVRQVLHHLPDSHLNAYVRIKLGLTEEVPAIKTYEEGRWAELPDSRDTPPEVSLVLLEALHARWMVLLRALGQAEWARTFRHPEWGEMSLGKALAQYAWHGRHHVAHVTRLRERMGW
ncbi:MAG TPA: bacillithiol transferase BstA [Longimicrobiaceae bacterium]|nr:bacillithiol transferase BstA [Longimicrobiaceae bacterium]